MPDTICDTKLAFGRVEIRTGVGHRRRWTAQEKGRIVAEALNAGVPVAEIGRRHDVSSQHQGHAGLRDRDPGQLAQEARFDGIFVVRTITKITPLQAVPRYRDLLQVENLFLRTKAVMWTRLIIHS
jgi:transposase-like protein